jgi:hypothetical protein
LLGSKEKVRSIRNTPDLALKTLRINGYTSKINDLSQSTIESDKRSQKSNDEREQMGTGYVLSKDTLSSPNNNEEENDYESDYIDDEGDDDVYLRLEYGKGFYNLVYVPT